MEGFDTRVVMPYDSVQPPFGFLLNDYYERTQLYKSREEFLKDLLYRVTVVPTDPDKYAVAAHFTPGSTFDGKTVGPCTSTKIMVIGKIPYGDESKQHAYSSNTRDDVVNMLQKTIPPIRLLMGGTWNVMMEAFKACGVKEEEAGNFYYTTVVKFPTLTPHKKGKVPVAWAKECRHLLQQEIDLLDPSIILCLGTDASQEVIDVAVMKAQGQVFEKQLKSGKKAKVVCAIDPIVVIDNFEKKPMLLNGISLFADVYNGTMKAAPELNLHYVDNESELQCIVDYLIESGHTEFTVDTEWGGAQHFLDDGVRLRTIQVGWSPKDAFVVVLRRAGLRDAFSPHISSALIPLRKLFYRPGVKIIGHNVAVDMQMLYQYGLDLEGYLYFDTMLASHLFEPTGAHDLDTLAVSIIPGWTRHDIEVTAWKSDKNNGFNEKLAYAQIPDDILHPYGAKDVCATFSVYQHYVHKFKSVSAAGLKFLFTELVMPATLAFIEIERNGVYMDRARLLEMEDIYRTKYFELLRAFREMTGKPYFNPNSAIQKQTLLFEELGLPPVKTTGKYPRMWHEVVNDGEQKLHAPAVDDETLGILAGESPVAKALQDICLISTVRKSFLTPKVIDPVTGQEDYSTGLIGFIKSDGRLHPHISQMLKTGRLASYEPNLMNMPNQQEGAIRSAAGGGICSIRSCFMSAPGTLIVAADYMQAEIATLAYLSGDENLILAVETGQDVHSTVCKKMFKLDCPVEDIKKKHKGKRVAAKAIVFGLLYGRGAQAIAREVEAAGVPCSVQDAKAFVEDFMQQFPRVAALIKATQDQVVTRHMVDTLWGRREYFYSLGTHQDEIEARQKRMGFNFTIQGYVADLLRKALINLQQYRREHDVQYKLILTVHDSIMLETPIKYVEQVATEVLPLCMTKNARAPRLGFSIGTDVDVFQRWDEKMYLEDMVAMGLREEFALGFCAKADDGSPKRRAA